MVLWPRAVVLHLVALVAVVSAQDGAEWQAIPGIKTTYKVLKEGKKPGAVVEVGDTVTVHATGTVHETQMKFWSTKDKGQRPFENTAGGGVITGWDMGARGMREGEVRLLQIPAEEGYGVGGFPAWGIPPGASLDFELEVLKIADAGGKSKPAQEL
mmetsp:Transcript_17005/g.46818  ORF Transcript_17005/g.46818 Transcript_17005/m.46818 type:complete len:156 (-) Transcript_17005:166-633(-)